MPKIFLFFIFTLSVFSQDVVWEDSRSYPINFGSGSTQSHSLSLVYDDINEQLILTGDIDFTSSLLRFRIFNSDNDITWFGPYGNGGVSSTFSTSTLDVGVTYQLTFKYYHTSNPGENLGTFDFIIGGIADQVASTFWYNSSESAVTINAGIERDGQLITVQSAVVPAGQYLSVDAARVDGQFNLLLEADDGVTQSIVSNTASQGGATENNYLLLALSDTDPTGGSDDGDYEPPDVDDGIPAPDPNSPDQQPAMPDDDFARTGDIDGLKNEITSQISNSNQHQTDLFNSLITNLNIELNNNRDILIDIVREVDEEGDQTQSKLGDIEALIFDGDAEEAPQSDLIVPEGTVSFDEVGGRVDGFLSYLESLFPSSSVLPTVSGRQYQYSYQTDLMGQTLDLSFSLSPYQDIIELLRSLMKGLFLLLGLNHFISVVKSAFAN